MTPVTTPSELVQSLYHVRQSSKLGRIVEQVDAVARLLAKVLAADFVTVFYNRSAGSGMIPVACHGWKDNGVAELVRLETAFRDMHSQSQRLRRGVMTFDYGDALQGDDLAQFASANQFSAGYQYPLMLGGDLRGMIVAFWHERSSAEHTNAGYLLNTLAELLTSWIAIVEEAQSANSFSLRMSMLIALFDLPLDEYPVHELANRMARTVQLAVRGCTAVVLSRELATGRYRITDFCGPQSNDAILRDTVLSQVSPVLNDVRSGAAPEQPWYDLSDRFRDIRCSVVVVEIRRDEKYHIATAFCRDDFTGFSVNDLDLISVYRLFAESVLANALLVRGLQKHNQKVVEASGRIADAETMAALADMSSGIAHDLNNTIGAVVGRLQLLKMKNADEKLGVALDKIEVSALEAAGTIARLQQFSSSVKARTASQVDLSILFDTYRNAEHAWQKTAGQRQVEVEFTRTLDSGSINGSIEDFTSVLDRLVQNAVDFTADGTTVHVTLGGTDRLYCLQVADAGPGIPEAIRQKVFYPFFSTKSVRGAGLGLSVVYGVTSRLGGKVHIECPPEGGTVVQVTFPRTVDGKEITETSRKIVKVRKLHVLLVDDEEQIREILTDMLTIEGHDTCACDSGQAAVQQLESRNFDIMITDLGMPGMSGIELAERAHRLHPRMPIILITGWGTQLNPDEIASKGIKALLPKPFHLRDIKSRIMELSAPPAAHIG